jgi:hypothetical protein
MDQEIWEQLKLRGMIPRGLTIDDEVKVMKQWEARLAASGQMPIKPMPIKPVKDKVELPDIKSKNESDKSKVEVPQPAIALPFTEGKQIIDCSVRPEVPTACGIVERFQIIGRVTGKLVWDPSKIDFHVTYIQKTKKVVRGTKVKEALAGVSVLPANVWDWMKEDPQNRVPKSWDNIRGCLIFWGHIFSDWQDVQSVRYMYHSANGWQFNLMDIKRRLVIEDIALCLM